MPLFPRLLLARTLQRTLARYLGASVVALGVDVGCYLLLLRVGLGAMAASALAYGLGIAVHWLLSSRAVFAGHVAAPGRDRLRQQALFVGSALVGLVVTTLVVGALAMAGVDARAAKLAAIAFSFAVTWLLRERVVFA
jgi:putative flippase GtrA